jgi:hypothetical protein
MADKAGKNSKDLLQQKLLTRPEGLLPEHLKSRE